MANVSNAINSSTVVSLAGTPSNDAQTIALATANGGIAVYQTDKELYVTEFTQQVLNQRAITTYSNVTQNISSVNNNAAGSANGSIQFTDGNGNFRASQAFKVTANDASATYSMDVSGSINTRYLTASAEFNTPNATIALLSATTINSTSLTSGTITANSANINGNANVTGDITTSGNANVTGDVTASNANLGNLVTANYFAGTLTTVAQPNVTSVANTLTVGTITVDGSTPSGSAVLKPTANGNTISMSTSSSDGLMNYSLTLNEYGNVVLPQTSSTDAVLSAQEDMTFTASAYTFRMTNGGNLTVPSAVNAANANITNNITANNITATNVITANLLTGTLTTAAQPNITSVGNLTSLVVTGNLSAGNITAVANLSAVDINANTANIQEDAIVHGSLTVVGNLEVDGSLTYIDSSRTSITDPMIELGATLDANGDTATLLSNDGKDRGLLLHRYDTATGVAIDSFMGWDNSDGCFVFASNVTNNSNGVVTINGNLGNIKADQIFANVTGNFGGNLAAGTSVVGFTANGGNVVITSNAVDMLTVSSTGIFANGTANINAAVTLGDTLFVTGNVTANRFIGAFANGTSSVDIIEDGEVTVSAAGVSNVFTVSGTGANVAGTFDVQSGNGNLTVGAGGAAVNGNLTVSLAATVTGNLSAGNVTATSVTGNLVNGNGKIVIDSTANTITLTAASSNDSNVANASTLVLSTANAVFSDDVTVTGLLTATGNITTTQVTVANIISTGTDIVIKSAATKSTFIGADGNANIVTISPSNTTIAGDLFVTGNVNGTIIGSISGNLSSGNSNVRIEANSNVTISSNGVSNVFTVTGTGANVTGTANITGDITTAGNANVTGNVTVTGDITAVNATLSSNLSVNGGGIDSSNATVNLLNSLVTTLNIGGSATAVAIGASSGNLQINNPNVSGQSATANVRLWGSSTDTITLGATAANVVLGGASSTVKIGGALSVTGDANVGNIGAGNAAFTANVTAGNIDSGNLLTANYANLANVLTANVANVTTLNVSGETVVSGNILPSGNVAKDIGSSTKRFKDLWLSGTTIHLGTADISADTNGNVTLGGVTFANGSIGGANVTFDAGNLSGTILNANVVDSSLTSVGTLGNLDVSGNVTANNITVAANIVLTGELRGNGASPAPSINAFSSASFVGNVTAGNLIANGTITGTLASTTQANITTVGTLTGLSVDGDDITLANGVFSGNGSGLTNIVAANVTGTVANATYATSSGTAGTVTANAQPNIESVGLLTGLSIATTGNLELKGSAFITAESGGFATTDGDITSTNGNIAVGGSITSSGNVIAGNITTGGSVIAANLTANTGNITATAGIFNGDGAGLSNIATASIVGAMDTAPDVLSNVAISGGVLSANIGAVNTTFGNVVTLTIGGVTYQLLAV
jgi:hypothetical protein